MNRLTLNIGCGDRTYTEYPSGHKCINVDERLLSGVDEVMDACKLNFQDEHFFYILASDIIEHFPIVKTGVVLKEWLRVLKPGGIIEFRLPNLRAICDNYIRGRVDAELTSWLLYGGQEYRGNFHYAAFDRGLFSSLIKNYGLVEIDYKEIGNNFEMRARKDG